MLTVKDTMTLDFEGRRWKYPAAKEAATLDLFGESATRYYQRLDRLLDNPEALAYAPMTVRRLHRLRDQRRTARSCAQYAPGPHSTTDAPDTIDA